MRPETYKVGDLIAGAYLVRRTFGGAGASGMGIVYLVEERGAPDIFVLKGCQLGDPTLESTFKREADLWVRIGSHPNVAKALWVRSLDEQLFVAAEYVRGAETGFGSLAEVVGKEVAPEQVVKWSMQFCSGLTHALARGLIAHRDIKPANLLLTESGDLKIADFGLGKMMPAFPLSGPTSSAASTGVSGTVEYMAPEQIMGVPSDARCDIYAFGIVLYELCSQGDYPYEVARPFNTLTYPKAHLHGVVRVIESPFWPIIERCLKRSANDRWRTPADLAAAIQDLARNYKWSCPSLVPPQAIGLEELYAKAQSLSSLGRPAEALAAIETYLSESPEAYWAWTEKCRILMELKRDLEAEKAVRQSLTLNPAGSHAWNNLGLVLRRQGRASESKEAFERALHFDPLNGGAMMNAADVFCAEKNFDHAATLLCTALRLTPKKQTLQFNAGNIAATMLASRALDPAERVLLTLIDSDSGNSQAWHNLGLIKAAKGDRLEALKFVRTGLRLEPENADGRLLLARLCAESGLFEEAIVHLDRLIAGPGDAEKAVCFKAQLLAHQDEAEAAMELLEGFLSRSPVSDSAWFILCTIAEGHGDLEKALRAAQACATILQRRQVPINSENVRWVREKVRTLSARLRAY